MARSSFIIESLKKSKTDNEENFTVFFHSDEKISVMQVRELKLDRNWKIPLVKDLLRNTLFQYCTTEDAITLAAASAQFDALPEYHNAPVKILLQYIAKATELEYLAGLAMAAKNPEFIVTKVTFTEEWCGQREWKKPISPLVRAAWAGDTQAVDAMLALLTTKELKEEALNQLIELKEKGTEHGKHLSAIDALILSHNKHNERRRECSRLSGIENWPWGKLTDECQISWAENIGKSQLHSVANLFFYYCDNTFSFNSLPESLPNCPRKLTFKEDDGHLFPWDKVDLTYNSYLGKRDGIMKGDRGQTRMYGDASGHLGINSMSDGISLALDFLQLFHRERTKDLDRQIQELGSRLDNRRVAK